MAKAKSENQIPGRQRAGQYQPPGKPSKLAQATLECRMLQLEK